ncbi:ATP-binding protein [Clostridium butyricum]|uniref:sensor histidine kinase n=1 Tax=Clostridium butyricum TaxID=1492 RepID=UPI003D333094
MKFSIRYKFAIGFLLIFCTSFNCITLFVNQIVVKNNQKIIYDEFQSSQRDIDMYLNQYMIINDIIYDENNLNEYFQKIGSALNSKLNERIILYSKSGNIAYDSDYNNGNLYLSNGTMVNDDFSDFKSAVNGKPAYKIINVNGIYEAVLSKPLYVNEDTVVIFRYMKDYTELFQNGMNMILNIKLLMLGVFLILFIFSFTLSTKIVIPIIKLNRVTNEISNGNFDFDLSVKSNDEIGELAQNFEMMKIKVKNQIDTIKKDRDDLIKSESHRKVFYDNVTHEIKTPLTIIDGYAQMILDEEGQEENIVTKAASKIKNESNKLVNMIIDILNLSKLESKSSNDLKEKIDVKMMIENICNQIGIKAKKYEISIEKQLEDNLYVYANCNDISSIIVNILDNSIKYSNVRSLIKINVFKDKDMCCMNFEDEGKGIESESLKNIFEPFYRGENTLEDRKKGNGLGLSIVKSIVDKYNGEIKIDSRINEGTRVCVKVPLFTNWQQVD